MSDIFREVDEELRQDKLTALWKKYGNVILGAAVLIVAVTAGVTLWKDRQHRAQEASSEAYVTAAALLAAAVPGEAQTQTVGMFVNDPRASDGYTLYMTQASTFNVLPVQQGAKMPIDLHKSFVAVGMVGEQPIAVAVNVSARQFSREDLAASIMRTLRETALDPRLLELELTESTVMHNAERAAEVLQQLSKLGVRVAIEELPRVAERGRFAASPAGPGPERTGRGFWTGTDRENGRRCGSGRGRCGWG